MGGPLAVINRLKKRAARVNSESWHYNLVTHVWKRTLKKGKVKACKYWWVMLPTSLVSLGLVAVTVAITFVVVYSATFFAGRRMNLDDTPYGPPEDFFPYKQRSDGAKVRFAPWEIVTPIAILALLYLRGQAIWNWVSGLFDENIHFILKVLMYTGIVVGILFVIGLAVFFFIKGWKHPMISGARSMATQSVDSGWSKLCPPLEVIKPPQPEEQPN